MNLFPEKILQVKNVISRNLRIREDIQKKCIFLVVGPLRFYPPYTNGLVVQATFFSFFFFQSYNSLKRILTIFLFLSNFCAKTAGFQRKIVVFCLVVRGVYPPYTLSGPTTQKKHFMCVFPNLQEIGRQKKLNFILEVMSPNL